MVSLWIQIGIVGTLLYLILLGYLGYYGSRSTLADVSDYFVADGSLGSLIMFLTSAGTAFSALTFLGGGGLAYNLGPAGPVTLGGLFLMDLPMMVVVGLKIWKTAKIRATEMDYVTPADLLCDRYLDSRILRIEVAIIAAVSSFFYVTVQFKGVGLVAEILTDGLVTQHQAIAAVALFMAAYIAIGGMRGVALTDALQSALLYFGVVVIAGFILFTRPELYREAATQTDIVTTYTLDPIYMYSFAAGFGITLPMWPQIWERYYASRRVSGVWSMSLAEGMGAVLLLIIFACIVGLAGIGAFPNLEQPDTVALQFIQEMPGVVLVFLIPAAVAAAMSTADSIILMIGSIISRDVYQSIIRSSASEERLSTYSKIISAVLTISAALFAFRELGEIGQFALDFAFPGYMLLLPPTLAAFWWKDANVYGTVLSMLVGGIYIIYITFQGPLLENPSLWPGFKAFFVSGAVLIIVSLVTPQDDDEEASLFTDKVKSSSISALERSHNSSQEMPTDD